MSESKIYSFELKDINGEPHQLSEFKDKVLLVVNVASQCGFTPQYTGLQKLYEKYRDQGFEILAFPCNQFGGQEPGSEQDIKQFCSLNYQVKFPVFSKVEVNGPNAHPLFEHLKKEEKGVLGTEAIKWNFTKFLVGRNGEVLKRFASTTNPKSIEPEIEGALTQKAS